MLRMEAVTHKAKVYWNDQFLCEHKGGFLPFEAEITPYIKSGENRLTIAVDNRIDRTTLPVGGEAPSFASEERNVQQRNYPRFDFFNYCGITRPVKIYTTPKEYIEDVTLIPSIEGDDGIIDYCVQLSQEQLPVSVRVLDKNGVQVGSAQGPGGRIVIPHAHTVERCVGYLYQVQMTAGEDVYTLPFGIRTVKVEGARFLINGRPFYFKGYGKHEDTFPNGRGFNPVMNAKDLSLMKWQGANSFRTSHYPYSEEMMRLCDQEGIVVIDETSAVGLNFKVGVGISAFEEEALTFRPYEEGGVGTFEHHKDVIRELITRDKNHACVVMWSIANEPDCYSKGAYEYFKPLFDLARSLDPQKRPCTMVSMQGDHWKEDVSLRLSDVICLNRYYGWYSFCGELKEAQKALREELEWWNTQGLPIMMTEYGADTVAGLRDSMRSCLPRNTRWPITKCITKFSILWTTLSENMHGILQILPHARPSAVFRAIRKVFLQETAVQKWQLITLNSAGKISRTLITNKPVSKTQRQQGIRPDALPLPPLLPQLFFHFLPVFFGRHAVGLFKKPEKR